MMRMLLTAVAALIANAVGLLLAALVLPGFSIDFWSFVIVVLVFTVVMLVASPLVSKLASSYIPQIRGSITLITVFFGLKITELLLSGFDMGGLSNWLAATFLVWLGSLISEILIPIFVFKQLRDHHGQQ